MSVCERYLRIRSSQKNTFFFFYCAKTVLHYRKTYAFNAKYVEYATDVQRKCYNIATTNRLFQNVRLNSILNVRSGNHTSFVQPVCRYRLKIADIRARMYLRAICFVLFFTNPLCQSLRPSSKWQPLTARCIELPIKRLKIIYRPILVTQPEKRRVFHYVVSESDIYADRIGCNPETNYRTKFRSVYIDDRRNQRI